MRWKHVFRVGCALVLSACPGSSEGDVDLDLGLEAGTGDGGGSAGDGGDDAGSEDAGGRIFVDLADVVGGGDGTGTGAAQGIDMLTGAVAMAQASALDCLPNVFVPASNALVDGVFCPDGGEAEDLPVPITSAGLTVIGIPDWTPITFSEPTWDHVWNGANTDVETGFEGPQIGAHAGKGITFDLRAIGAAHGGTATRFTATAGIGTRAPFPENVVSFLVAVDDMLVFEERAAADAGSRFPIDVTIPEGASTLTLIAAATGDIQGDWSFWGAPTVELR